MDYEHGLWYGTDVGDVTPVAARRGPTFWYPRAVIWALYGIAVIAAAVEWLLEDGRVGDAAVMSISALMIVGGLWCLAIAYKRIRSAHDDALYLMAGPGGIAWSVPHVGVTGYSVSHHLLRWDQVESWQPYILTVNAITADRELRFSLHNGAASKVDLHPYTGSPEEVADAVHAARYDPAAERPADAADLI